MPLKLSQDDVEIFHRLLGESRQPRQQREYMFQTDRAKMFGATPSRCPVLGAFA